MAHETSTNDLVPRTASIHLDQDQPTPGTAPDPQAPHTIVFEPYSGEHQMQTIIELIEKELSEPYIVYTYRYFVNQWPNLCFLAYARFSQDNAATDTSGASNSSQLYPVGVIVCKLDRHLKGARLLRGYIAMISIRDSWRGRGLAKLLVKVALEQMILGGAQEIVLETEVDNKAALALYQSQGFIREKRLHRFYLNGKDSFRLILPVPPEKQQMPPPSTYDQAPEVGLAQPPQITASQQTSTASAATFTPNSQSMIPNQHSDLIL